MTQGLTHAHAAPKWCCPRCYLRLAEQSDKEGWPAARFLAALAEHEIADRGRRRIERHLAEVIRGSQVSIDTVNLQGGPIGLTTAVGELGEAGLVP
jgi:hypothetical protein